jgi:hypothetical protein
MIRRAAGTDAFHLIAQHDHAVLAASLAARVGNAQFARPTRGEETLAGIRLHDCGWPLHDDAAPVLNKHGLPSDVFETTPDVGVRVWTASADRAADAGPYAQLLVSLHVLALSAFATGNAPVNHEKFDLSDPKNRFAINKFQQREIERQESLRRQLGLRTDLPLEHGLAAEHASPSEDAVRADFRLLQAMDQLSLGMCCTQPPQAHTTPVHPQPAGTAGSSAGRPARAAGRPVAVRRAGGATGHPRQAGGGDAVGVGGGLPRGVRGRAGRDADVHVP